MHRSALLYLTPSMKDAILLSKYINPPGAPQKLAIDRTSSKNQLNPMFKYQSQMVIMNIKVVPFVNFPHNFCTNASTVIYA